MFNIFFALFIFSTVFFLLLASVILGRKLGKWQMEKHSLKKLEPMTVVEGAIFTLLGLLIAFTFTGAFDRFELRKTHIIEEANAIDTAYLRLDLLIPSARPALQQSFRDYLDSRLRLYHKIPDFVAMYAEYHQSNQLEKKIWQQILAACQLTHNDAATQLVVQAINDMFDVEKVGYSLVKIHPPVIIFFLLLLLAVLSTFLSGYTSAERNIAHATYIFIYAAITAFTIYLIIDLELPRMGLIRVDSFDQALVDVRQEMT